MSATITLGLGRQAWRATSRDDLAPAFRRARRHSRMVRLLRIGLPLGTVGGMVLYALGTWLNPLAGINLPTMRNLSVSGTKITMDAPRLAGYTRDGRSYELTARAAAQDLRKPQFMELQDVRARMEMQDGDTVRVTADAGDYDNKSEIVTLKQNVIVTTSNGVEVRLVEATLDMRKNHVVSEQPVEILTPNGQINAKQMEVINGGEVVHFRGGVRLVTNANAAAGGVQGARP
jgi:lipopolysaccharide export system protein LptC